ncbi:MAG: hypothetical protein KKH92_02925 [Firmicutes bacterium]|nr:hypothetical protein [Bacillota bacterium]
MPKKRINRKNDKEVIHLNESLLYQFRTNIFSSKFELFNQNDKLLFTAKQVTLFRNHYDIYQNDTVISSLVTKSYFKQYQYYIKSNKDNLFVEGSIVNSQFSLREENEVVLTISKDPQKNYRRIITVDESQKDYLIMVMLSLIVAVETFMASN